MSATIMRRGIAAKWPKGDTPYGPGMVENLRILSEENFLLVTYRRKLPALTNNVDQLPAFSQIGTNQQIQFYQYVRDGGFYKPTLIREVAPFIGQIVIVTEDACYVIFTASGWKHLWDYGAGPTIELSFDCYLISAGRPAATYITNQPFYLPPQSHRAQFHPLSLYSGIVSSLTFPILKNDVQIGDVRVYRRNTGIEAPAIDIGNVFFEPGDELKIMCPPTLYGFSEFALTLVAHGIV